MTYFDHAADSSKRQILFFEKLGWLLAANYRSMTSSGWVRRAWDGEAYLLVVLPAVAGLLGCRSEPSRNSIPYR